MSVIEAPPEPREAHAGHQHKVGYLQLTFLIYGAACGGAFGLEGMIPSAGPGLALTLILVIPFIYSVPLSLAVSELTAMFPIEGGNYTWSRMCFGNFWGFQAGWWSWASGVVAAASYAALFADYVNSWVPQRGQGGYDQWSWLFVVNDAGVTVLGSAARWGVCLILIWILHYLNYRGIDVVGDSAVIMTALLLTPFLIMTVLGLLHWNHNPLVPFSRPNAGLLDFGAALAAGVWLYSGYEKLSNAAEEVEDPQRIFPPALFTAASLAMLSCLVPTACALANLGNWDKWTDGYFPTACLEMAGPWLQQSMLIGGLISNALLLGVTMLAVSRTLYAMSHDHLMPRALGELHPRYETPVWSLLIGSIVLSLMSWFSFRQLLIAYLWLQMFSNFMIYVNVWTMRSTHRDQHRPFTVPLGWVGLTVITVPTVLLALFSMISAVFPEWQFNQAQLNVALIATFTGPVIYFVGRLWQRRQGPD